jgi:hypothetical protein
LFAESLKDKKTHLVLYGTWPRKDKPEQGKTISDAYAEICIKIAGCKCAFVGTAFAKVKNVELYDKDLVHANANGSYLAACLLFATIFEGESPIGLKSKVPQAKLLQEVAWETKQE